MASRLELQEKLTDLIGNGNVYFQPPESVKIKYPCFVYKRTRPYNANADNQSYLFMYGYNILYIDRDPDNDMTERMLKSFKRIEAGSAYTADGLYHYSFELYF